MGGVGAPGAILFAGAVLICFAFGFTAMSQSVRNAGAFYAYVSRGLGKPVGLAVSSVTVFAYIALVICFYGFIGFFAEFTFAELFGLERPWGVYSIAAVLIVGLLGYNKIDVGAKVLAVLLTLEVGILLVLAIAALVDGGPEHRGRRRAGPQRRVRDHGDRGDRRPCRRLGRVRHEDPHRDELLRLRALVPQRLHALPLLPWSRRAAASRARPLVRAQSIAGGASLTLTVLSLVAVVIALIVRADPFLGLALWTYATGVQGLVFAQAVTAVAVVWYFVKDRRGHSPWRVIVAPAIGALGLSVGYVLIVTNFEVVTGLEGSINQVPLLPTPILFIGGIMVGLVLRRRRPAYYASLTESVQVVPVD